MKRSIGIISMQRIINYGSFLQAYGLKRMIENTIDCNVQFIDYHYERSLVDDYSKTVSLIQRIKNNKSVINYLKKKKFFIDVKKALVEDLKGIGVDDFNYNPFVDTLVIGSDEVFNCMQPYPVGYSRELFGKGFDSSKLITYAASFGHTSLNDLINENIEDEIKGLLSNFKAISVRDNNSLSIIRSLLGFEAQVHMDPVLIYDFDNEMNAFTVNDKNYIIVYAYAGRMSPEEECVIRKFAKRLHKKIYSVGHYSGIADKNIICHPFYVFSYFKNADYIITDTFHGTVFSVKTNSKFCTIIRDGNRNKLEALLFSLGRFDRAVNDLSDIEKLYYVNIDYSETNNIIAFERLRSSRYLKENL